MRVVTNKELSTYKVLPFDLYTESKGKIMDAGEVLTPGKLITLKNYSKLYTEEFGGESQAEDKQNDNNLPSQLLNFSYETLDAIDFSTVINKDAYVKAETQVKIKYFYQRILDLFLKGYPQEGLLKLNTMVGVLKNEVFKTLGKTGKGSRVRFLGEYELCHPLNVAVISGLIAKKLEYTAMAFDQVVLSALLHDIGKLKFSITGENAIITTNEDEVKEHTILGYKMIKDELGLPDEIAKVALEHHENNDGSGYPQGLSSDYISEYSQIVNVANFYDNLAFNRTHVQITNNKEALRTMLEVGTKRFSAQMLYSFIHMFNYDDSTPYSDISI